MNDNAAVVVPIDPVMNQQGNTAAVVSGNQQGKAEFTVLIVGASSPIGVQAALVAGNDMLGPNHVLRLHLYDEPSKRPLLTHLRTEIISMAFDRVSEVLVTTDIADARVGVSFAVIIGHFATTTPESRRTTARKNFGLYKEWALALRQHGANCRVVLVSHPVTFSVMAFRRYAPEIPPQNITSLTRADHLRATNIIADRLGVLLGTVRNVVAWGLNSSVQHMDINYATVENDNMRARINNDDWLRQEFRREIRNRACDIDIGRNDRRRTFANVDGMAICQHIRDWHLGTQTPGTWVSVGMFSDGAYGVNAGEFGSFPAYCVDGAWVIEGTLSVVDFLHESVLEARAASHNFHVEALDTMQIAEMEMWE